MANKVTAQVTGGKEQTIDGATTPAELMAALDLEGSYEATINGEPASLTDTLVDYAYVSFSEKVKGGC